MSVVATVGNPARIVAHAGFEPIDEGAAEIAFEVADGLRGRGLATLLMAQLAARAREQGIATFVAEVLPDNRRMLEVFRESGFPMRIVTRPGSSHRADDGPLGGRPAALRRPRAHRGRGGGAPLPRAGLARGRRRLPRPGSVGRQVLSILRAPASTARCIRSTRATGGFRD